MESPTISKTQQYRKVMKPMLERKRRARINKCLDQLKELIIQCMKEDDEHILKLEKADILEHTVEYIRKIKSNEKNTAPTSTNSTQNLDDIKESFRNGYIHAANEVSKILASTRGINTNFGIQLMSHLGYKLNTTTTTPAPPQQPIVSAPVPLDLISSKLMNYSHKIQEQNTFSEKQQSHGYYQMQKRYFSPMSVNVPALSPVSSGYHSDDLSSPVPSEDSSDLTLYQNHIKHNCNNNNNKENVWRPW